MLRSEVYWNYKIRSHPLNKVIFLFIFLVKCSMKCFRINFKIKSTHVAESIELHQASPKGCRGFVPRKVSFDRVSLVSSVSQVQYKDTNPDTKP